MQIDKTIHADSFISVSSQLRVAVISMCVGNVPGLDALADEKVHRERGTADERPRLGETHQLRLAPSNIYILLIGMSHH